MKIFWDTLNKSQLKIDIIQSPEVMDLIASEDNFEIKIVKEPLIKSRQKTVLIKIVKKLFVWYKISMAITTH